MRNTPVSLLPSAPECVDVARLVLAGQALVVASAVLADVLGVGLGQLLNSSHDGLWGWTGRSGWARKALATHLGRQKALDRLPK